MNRNLLAESHLESATRRDARPATRFFANAVLLEGNTRGADEGNPACRGVRPRAEDVCSICPPAAHNLGFKRRFCCLGEAGRRLARNDHDTVLTDGDRQPTMGNASTTKPNLERIMAGAQLPALPQSAIRLLELSQDADNGPAEFACPIESDPGLAAQVLRFVNSSYFGFSREISSVRHAITLVGVRTIKNFALWSAVFSLLPNPRCGPFDLKSLRQDSLRRALFARLLARLFSIKEVEEVFSAALLQDMAVPLLAKEAPDAYASLLESRDQGRVRLSALEQERFGWTHAKAGGLMARTWSFPEGFAELIENHIEMEHCLGQSGADPRVVAVAVSALLPAIGDPVWNEWPLFEQAYQKVIPANAPPPIDLLRQADELVEELAPALKLAVPKKSLVDAFNEVVGAEA